jgi:PAS domain S-box-containing protein
LKKDNGKSSLIQSMRTVTLRILIIGMAGVLAVGIFDRIVLMNTTIKGMSKDYHSHETAMIKIEVESIYRLIHFGIENNISQEEVLKAVRKKRFGENEDGYIFIVSYKGTVLLNNPRKDLEGKNQWDLTDLNGIKIFQEQRKAIEKPGGDFIYYSWNKPSTSETSPKASFVMGIPEWEWMIGAGIYLDDLEKVVIFSKNKIYKDFLVRALLFLIFLLLIFQYIFRNFRGCTSLFSKEVSAFTKLIEESASSNSEINLNNIHYKEFLSAARDTNKIVLERLKADKKSINTEKQLLLQRQQSPLAYIGWNTEKKIIEWNPSAERVFGYTRNEAMGKDLDIIVPKMSIPEVMEVFTDLKRHNNVSRHVNKNITKDGGVITCEWYNNHLIDDNGKSFGIVAIGQDISERIKNQNEISQKNIELEESLAEKEVLLKEVHHRVKNNLAIISSLLSLQSTDINDNNIQNLFQSSQNRVKSMALVHELLYKSESLKDINLNQYLKELLNSLRDSTTYRENQIELIIDIADIELELDLLIPLGMLINEIVSNSFKYAFNNCLTPELTVSLKETGSNRLLMTIHDNGPGFKINEVHDKSGSIGLMLIEGLTQQIHGNLMLNTENGTEYKLSFSK